MSHKKINSTFSGKGYNTTIISHANEESNGKINL